jgi:hypothetical protein
VVRFIIGVFRRENRLKAMIKLARSEIGSKKSSAQVLIFLVVDLTVGLHEVTNS